MELTVEQIAHVVHEANRVIQRITKDAAVSPPWLESPASQRDSAMEGVRKALEGAGPEELHEQWVQWRLERGWKYGRVKDDWGKTHPCMVPYADLPPEQRIKDDLFLAIVRVLAQGSLTKVQD